MEENTLEVTHQTWSIAGETFFLEKKYKLVDYLGAGAYGMVCGAIDRQTKQSVAIKKCRNIFHSKTLAKRTLRELRILRLVSHDNIIKLIKVLKPADETDFNELYLVFELMDTDLAQIIRSPQQLREEHLQYFMTQIMSGLAFLHDLGVIHRDMKPRNILVNADCKIKIADFGLARLHNNNCVTGRVAITDYVTTRWYRAPEVIVGWNCYTTAIDIWAVGCIFAELLNRTPLFQGSSTMHQIELICEVLGRPSNDFILQSKKRHYREYFLNFGLFHYDRLRVLFPKSNPLAVDLLHRLVLFDPSRRLNASEALNHPYLKSFVKFINQNTTANNSLDDEFIFEGRYKVLNDLKIELINEVHQYLELPSKIDDTLVSSIVSDEGWTTAIHSSGSPNTWEELKGEKFSDGSNMNKDKYAEQSSEDQKQHSETFDSRIPRRVVSEGRPYRKHNGLVHAENYMFLQSLKENDVKQGSSGVKSEAVSDTQQTMRTRKSSLEKDRKARRTSSCIIT